MILKRLSDAIADGDTIDGIVRNTGFGQDGRTMGITMPSGPAQASVIKKTYSEAGLDLSNKLNWPQFVVSLPESRFRLSIAMNEKT